MSRGVVFLDTETTGLDPDRHEIWDVAWVSEDGTAFEAHPEPRRLDRADPTALRLTRFYERTNVETGWRWDERRPVAWRLAQELSGKHLVGAVPSFDAVFLSAFLRRYGLREAWHYHLVDVEALAAGKAGIAPPWDSEELSRAVGVDPSEFERHTALGDALWARAIYRAALGVARPDPAPPPEPGT